jgi:cytosine/creatinine deaminase
VSGVEPVPQLLPPLLLPRALIDPQLNNLPPADEGGLVAVRLSHQHGVITAIEAHPRRDGELLPLALTPLVEPHAHLDKAFSWEGHPNPAGTMQGALAANLAEHQGRSLEQVLERGERALERAWRYGLRAVRSHIDSLGPGAEPGWQGLLELQQRWAPRLALQLVALVPVRHWATAAGAAHARRLVSLGPQGTVLLGGVLGAPMAPSRADAEGLLACCSWPTAWGLRWICMSMRAARGAVRGWRWWPGWCVATASACRSAAATAARCLSWGQPA